MSIPNFEQIKLQKKRAELDEIDKEMIEIYHEIEREEGVSLFISACRECFSARLQLPVDCRTATDVEVDLDENTADVFFPVGNTGGPVSKLYEGRLEREVLRPEVGMPKSMVEFLDIRPSAGDVHCFQRVLKSIPVGFRFAAFREGWILNMEVSDPKNPSDSIVMIIDLSVDNTVKQLLGEIEFE